MAVAPTQPIEPYALTGENRHQDDDGFSGSLTLPREAHARLIEAQALEAVVPDKTDQASEPEPALDHLLDHIQRGAADERAAARELLLSLLPAA